MKSDAKPQEFVGRVVHFQNDVRRTAHTIAEARLEGEEIVLTTADDLLVGRARVERVEDDAVLTRTSLQLAPIYRGVTLGSARFEPLARVAEVDKGRIRLAERLSHENRPTVGDDVWLINVGADDRFELPALRRQ